MFIRVDLPAPFSPRSACTSPSRRSKSTSSFATMPGKRLVMWRISSTVRVASAIAARFYCSGPDHVPRHVDVAAGLAKKERAGSKARPLGSYDPAIRSAVGDTGARGLELAGRDLLRPGVELGDQGCAGRSLGADLAVTDAAVLHVEETVDTALILALRDELDRLRDACIDLLLCARENRRAEERLVVVDTDAPGTRSVGSGRDGAEAAATGNLEHDVRALTDLVESNRLALVLRDEVLRVAVERLDARLHLLGAVLVAGDVCVDGRDLETADRRDRAGLGRGRSCDTGEAPCLLLGEHDATDVLRLALEAGRVDVDDRELNLRVLLRDLGDRITHEEADRDHEVVALGTSREVRDVVRAALRDEDATLDAVLALRDLEAVVRERVEALVVQAADVGDERHLERCLLLGRCGGAATHDGEPEDRNERDRGTGHPFPY